MTRLRSFCRAHPNTTERTAVIIALSVALPAVARNFHTFFNSLAPFDLQLLHNCTRRAHNAADRHAACRTPARFYAELMDN